MITRQSIRGAFPIVKLGDLVQFLDHKRRPITASDRITGPYPYYGANGQQDSVASYLFDEPLVLLAEDGGHFDDPGRGIAYRIQGKSWVNNHAHVIRAREGLHLAYLCRVLENYDVRPYISGTTRAKLTKGQAEKIEIPLPSQETQQRIAAILDQADMLRQKRRKSLTQLSQLGQAIFVEMFGNPFSNEKDWPKVKLGDICGIGSSKRVFVSEFVNSGIPFYRGTEVGRLGASGTVEPELFIDAGHYQNLIQESGRPAIGDLLLPSICHDGRIWHVDHSDPFYFKDGRVLWIKSADAKIDGEYLRRHLQGMFLRDYNKIASGTTFAELKIVNLKNLEILYPPLKLQEEYADKVNSLEQRRSDMLRASIASDILFKSLQKRAFNGKL